MMMMMMMMNEASNPVGLARRRMYLPADVRTHA